MISHIRECERLSQRQTEFLFANFVIISEKKERGENRMKGKIAAAVTAVTVALMASPAAAQAGYADPAGSGVFVSAVSWLQGTLLGTVATVAAVIAVACVGFMMLTGRINWRYGATVILGCFILFGAASIVAGIHSTAMLGQ
jgi:type IV secretion system protein VirB2